jgi:MoaA/NifB/PqqE/SkfB family radical SAM enzyme
MIRAAASNGLAGRPSPLILLLEPSERCNARCPFCYHWREQAGPELSREEVARILKEAWDLGCRFLYLSGGEPTIHPDTAGTLCEARRLGFATSMTTNGSNLAAALPALAPFLDAVTVSIDFAGEAHDRLRGIPGLFRAAVDGLALAHRLKLATRINMNLCPANAEEVAPLIELARGVGAGLHVRLLTRESSALEVESFGPAEAAVEAGRILALKRRHRGVILTPDIYFDYIARQRPFRCRPLSLLLTVDAVGRVFIPCPRHEGTKERIAGDVRQASLEAIWSSAQAESIRREARSCKPSIDCYTSCILDISLLANLSPRMLLQQALGGGSLLDHFRGGAFRRQQ